MSTIPLSASTDSYTSGVQGILERVESQAERFRQAARDLGTDESDDALDRVMGRLDLTKKPDPEPKPAKK